MFLAPVDRTQLEWEPYDALVIGAGQAGLAAGYYLQRAGLRFAILDANEEPGGSWPSYYTSLTLLTPARYSGLPGLRFPGSPEHHPSRDEVCAYLRAYATRFDLPVLTRTRLEKIERDGDAFRVIDDRGHVHSGRAVIAATGSFGNPCSPDVPGRTVYRGGVLHAAEYRTPEPFRGQRVVVVGGGNSAAHIGCELATVARVTLARRRAISFVPQRLLGRSLYFWLRITGLDRSRLLTGRRAAVIDHGEYRDALRCDAPDERPMFRRFTEDGVQWPDGARERVDSVIFATGYKPCLRYLDGWPVCDSDGAVRQRDGACTTVDGLYFVGLADQTCFASASLRGVGRDAELVVRAIAELCGTRRHRGGAPVR